MVGRREEFKKELQEIDEGTRGIEERWEEMKRKIKERNFGEGM